METICNKLKAYLKIDNFPSMEEVTEILSEMCVDLDVGLKSMKNELEKKVLIKQHLEKAMELNASNNEKVPDFRTGLEWLNVTEPLSLYDHLKGKLVLLDFFTYCCINCMHILPELKKLETEFPVNDGLVVIGVHSAKFTNEKITANIESAVRRYEVCHPVVNDSIEGMWSALGVTCWPTQIVLGPNGEPLLIVRGEGHYETLRLFLREAIGLYHAKGQLSLKNVAAISAFQPPVSSSLLYYPGKVTISQDESLLAISDTAHHRVVVSSPDGSIQHIIGGTEAGFADGNFVDVRFSSPQGLTFINNDLIILADTDNHAIRKIDLLKKSVTTLVGNGVQGHDYTGGKVGMDQEISSPWDVCFIENLNVVFIAMAGTHQIWAYFLKDSSLWNKEFKANSCASVVGSGREENRNSRYPKSVGLAQPSGLSFNSSSNHLYFADSESSAIRCISLDNGATSLLAGGTLDPRNLFAYGDKDGLGMEAKLQHPLDVSWHEKGLFVADSYNHKIRRIDPSTKMCETIDPSKYKLNEPAGLSSSKSKLFIADTNNHCIKVMDLENYSTAILELKQTSPKVLNVVDKYNVKVAASGEIKINLQVSLSEGMSVNSSAPSTWTLFYPESKLCDEKASGELEHNWSLTCTDKEDAIAIIKARLFLCQRDLCTVKEFAFHVVPSIDDSAPGHALLNIQHRIE